MSFRTSNYADKKKFRAVRNKYKSNRRLIENLKAERKRMPYSAKEIELILSKSMSDKEIAEELGRNTLAIGVARANFKRKGYGK